MEDNSEYEDDDLEPGCGDEDDCKSLPNALLLFPLIVRTGTNSGRAIKQISGFFLPGFFGQSFAFRAIILYLFSSIQ